MRTTARPIGDVSCLITYDHDRSPLHVSITTEASKDPSFGALVYAIPEGLQSSKVHFTTLVSSEVFNEPAQQLAKALASRFQLPVFVNMSTQGSMALYSGVVELVGQVFEETKAAI